MQTFLPYPDFQKSAKSLDYRRLGKQRVEAYQILNTLKGIRAGWEHHPAVKMWRGYEDALTAYMNTMIIEWIRRGYNNTMQIIEVKEYELPKWIGNKEFHISHQSNLIRKLPEYYIPIFGENIPNNIPYIWNI